MRQVININKDKWTRPWEIEKFDDLKVRDERFFSIVIKGCLGWLTSNIIMYNKPIKHFIFNTGSSYMYVENNDYEFSWTETTGENMMYMKTPRCIVTIQDFSIPTEELSNPYIRGNYERYSQDGQIKGYNAEMRRLPLELNIQLQYVLSNFNEQIILIQELFDKLTFQTYFNVSYLGQLVQCSIEFPTSNSLNIPKVDLADPTPQYRTLELTIKINTSYPIINVDTEIPTDKVIQSFSTELILDKENIATDITKHIID